MDDQDNLHMYLLAHKYITCDAHESWAPTCDFHESWAPTCDSH